MTGLIMINISKLYNYVSLIWVILSSYNNLNAYILFKSFDVYALCNC